MAVVCGHTRLCFQANEQSPIECAQHHLKRELASPKTTRATLPYRMVKSSNYSIDSQCPQQQIIQIMQRCNGLYASV